MGPSHMWRYKTNHGLRTPGEEITFTVQPKIKSQSQIYSHGQSIICLPHGPKFSGFFDLCLHWVSVVRETNHRPYRKHLCRIRNEGMTIPNCNQVAHTASTLLTFVCLTRVVGKSEPPLQEAMITLRNLMECDNCIVSTGCR